MQLRPRARALAREFESVFSAGNVEKASRPPRGTRNAVKAGMANDGNPDATNPATSSTISNLFGAEQERATRALRRQARALEAKSFRCMKVDPSLVCGALPAPRFVFFLDDGRALAWFDETQPYVVHPSFEDLCEMHGLMPALVHAA